MEVRLAELSLTFQADSSITCRNVVSTTKH